MARPVTRRRTRDEDVPETDRYADADVADDTEEDGEDVDEVEEAPRRARRRDSENRHPAGRRSRSDEDGDRADRRRARSAPRKAPERGWKAINEASKSYGENLKFGDGEVLLKFLEEDPYASFQQHFIREAEGRKSFNCIGAECPLCNILGDDPTWKAAFNVVDLTDPQKPEVKTWLMGKKLATKLEKLSQKPRTSPLNRWNGKPDDLYWAAERTGTGLKTEYTVEAVLAEDLQEYYEAEPLTSEELAELEAKCLGPDSIKYDDVATLEDVATSL